MIEEKIDILTKLKFCEKEVITTYGQVSDSSFQLFLFKKKRVYWSKKNGSHIHMCWTDARGVKNENIYKNI